LKEGDCLFEGMGEKESTRESRIEDGTQTVKRTGQGRGGLGLRGVTSAIVGREESVWENHPKWWSLTLEDGEKKKKGRLVQSSQRKRLGTTSSKLRRKNRKKKSNRD